MSLVGCTKHLNLSGSVSLLGDVIHSRDLQFFFLCMCKLFHAVITSAQAVMKLRRAFVQSGAVNSIKVLSLYNYQQLKEINELGPGHRSTQLFGMT